MVTLDAMADSTKTMQNNDQSASKSSNSKPQYYGNQIQTNQSNSNTNSKANVISNEQLHNQVVRFW